MVGLKAFVQIKLKHRHRNIKNMDVGRLLILVEGRQFYLVDPQIKNTVDKIRLRGSLLSSTLMKGVVSGEAINVLEIFTVVTLVAPVTNW